MANTTGTGRLDGATAAEGRIGKHKTSAAAVFALVAVVFGLLAIVLGIVGLSRAKRPNVTGRGVAIGGWCSDCWACCSAAPSSPV